jgi:hypothetical protein
MLEPNVPRWGLGLISTELSVHNTSFGSSEAGATVAATGNELIKLLGMSEASAAGGEGANGAACTASMLVKKILGTVAFLRLNSMMQEVW